MLLCYISQVTAELFFLFLKDVTLTYCSENIKILQEILTLKQIINKLRAAQDFCTLLCPVEGNIDGFLLHKWITEVRKREVTF